MSTQMTQSPATASRAARCAQPARREGEEVLEGAKKPPEIADAQNSKPANRRITRSPKAANRRIGMLQSDALAIALAGFGATAQHLSLSKMHSSSRLVRREPSNLTKAHVRRRRGGSNLYFVARPALPPPLLLSTNLNSCHRRYCCLSMEISLLALAPLLFAARAFLALQAEQELHAPSIDADPAMCSQLGANNSYLSHVQFMLDRCPATVSTACTAQQAALHDAHHDPAECERWAVSRQCDSNPSFMTEQCNASCGELLLQQHAASLRMQLLAVRLAVPAAWQRDDEAANCSTVDASACLEDAERMMRLCPASCLGLGAPDNSSSHSCQLWAQRDECIKNAGYMKDACASTCSEHLFREQTRLRLARNTLGGSPC